MIIGLQNLSTKVTNEEVYNMSLLCDFQLRHHASPAWGTWPPQVMYLKPGQDITGLPAGSNIIGVFDNADQAGDLGWHTEGPGGIVYGRVFAGPILQNGGNALTNPLSVCSVASHECLETLGDAACNRYCDDGQGSAIALELGDPVESDSYTVTVGSVTGTVSNFVLPAWFDPNAAAGSKFDWMDLVTAPFMVRPTGYVISMTEGAVIQTFGEHYPAWRKDMKETELARTHRRLKQGGHG